MTHEAILRLAPVASPARLDDPRWQQPDRVMFWRGDSLQLLPGRVDAPLVVDHDPSLELGRVTRVLALDDIDGRWVCCLASLADPPTWLRSFRTKASFSRIDVHPSDPEPGRPVLQAWLKHASLCLATEAAEPGAQLVSLKRTEAKRIAAPAIRRAVPVHREDEEVDELHRRLTWHEMRGTGVGLEEILAAMQRELRGRGRLRLVG